MIHALPGTGADHRMYPEPWSTLPDFKAHDWVHSAELRSVRELAEATVAAQGIADGDVLIGSSLGGMVACEITRLRKIPQLFLIGSAVRKEEMNTLWAVLHPLVQVVPMDWLRFSAGKLPGELAAMFAAADPAFVRAMCLAIFEWEGLGVTATQVFRVHGRRDWVIPPPPQVDLLLDGGHLIAMTHATECMAFVAGKLGKSCADG